MIPRHLPAIILIVMIAACGQKPDSASSIDSLDADSFAPDSTSYLHSPVLEHFGDDDLFTNLLPFDLSDPDGMEKWFPGNNGDCEGMDNEDGTPWYRTCSYNNGLLFVTYHDFFDNNPERFYFYEITINDPAVEIAKGIHVGISKREFLDILNLKDPKFERATGLWNFHSTEEHKIFFQFEDERLKFINASFDYGRAYPKTIVELVTYWHEVYTNEGEGEAEIHSPCDFNTYTLEGVAVGEGDRERQKYILTVGLVQDTRVDTVEWIRRTSDGFVISAFNSFNAQQPYTTRIVFKDESWTLAEWNGTLFVSEGYGGPVIFDQCAGEEPD